jgi:hypothetical protein
MDWWLTVTLRVSRRECSPHLEAAQFAVRALSASLTGQLGARQSFWFDVTLEVAQGSGGKSRGYRATQLYTVWPSTRPASTSLP